MIRKNIYANFFILFLCAALCVFSGCAQGFTGNSGEQWSDESDNFVVSSNHILQNNEPWEVLTDRSKRMFTVNRPLQVILMSDKTLQITSYCLYPLNDVQVWARIGGYPERIRILTVSRLDSLAQNEYTIPLCVNSAMYETESGKLITMPLIEGFSGGMISLEITSSDPIYRSIASLKPTWKIYYGEYDASGTDASWAPINGLYAREWIALITNFAAALSAPEFDYIFFNYKEVTGTEFYRDKADSQTFFTDISQYRALYDDIMKKAGLKLGITTMGGGLGGGDVVGVDTWNLYKHYYEGSSILVHEFGHCMGFGHSSSFCYGEFESYMAQIWSMLIRLGKMPYGDEELNGFYRPENKAYQHAEIEDKFRRTRKKGSFNNVEKYIMEHPSGAKETAKQLEYFK